MVWQGSVWLLKATSHSAIFCACVYAIKDSDDVSPAKDGSAMHVLVIIPLKFACCTHPTHENCQVRSSLYTDHFS